AHRAEERFVHGDHNSFSHVSGLLVPVDGNDPLPEASELIGQSTGSRALSVVTIAIRQLDLQNLHLKYIARLGAIDVNGTHHDVGSRTSILHLAKDRTVVFRDLARRETGAFDF